VVGSGEAIVFSDGKVHQGTWEKGSAVERTLFLAEDGEEIAIRPGQVWVHLVPEGISVTWETK
jgi:hypothetical protein